MKLGHYQNDPHFLLLRGIKSILRCDEAEVVQGLARYVVSQHRSLRLLSALIERTRNTPIPAVIALVGWMRSVLSVRSGCTAGYQPADASLQSVTRASWQLAVQEETNGVVWIARLSNERRAIEKLIPLLRDLRWTELRFDARLTTAFTRVGNSSQRPHSRGNLLRVFKLAGLLHRRYEFFKVLRVVELIGYYMRYLESFRSARFDLAVMSSHSNPHGIAFNLAARKCRVPTVLISHGMPVRPVAKLRFDLAVVHCEAARQTYLEDGCQMDRVLTHGRRQDYTPMPDGPLPEQLTVGIFLCKDVNEERLRMLADRLLSNPAVSRILIRPHPKNLWLGLETWIASRNDSRLCQSASASVFADVQNSDVVLAGNSSVLVDAVTAGRPAGYVPGLDHSSPDLHAFVTRGLIFPIDEELRFDSDAMVSFYRRPEWLSVLRLFANVDEDEASINAQAVEIMRELAAARSG